MKIIYYHEFLKINKVEEAIKEQLTTLVVPFDFIITDIPI